MFFETAANGLVKPPADARPHAFPILVMKDVDASCFHTPLLVQTTGLQPICNPASPAILDPTRDVGDSSFAVSPRVSALDSGDLRPGPVGSVPIRWRLPRPESSVACWRDGAECRLARAPARIPPRPLG